MRDRLLFSLVCRHCDAQMMSVRLIGEGQLMRLRDHLRQRHTGAVRGAVLGVEETMRHFDVRATAAEPE